jgi:hypothetical protein
MQKLMNGIYDPRLEIIISMLFVWDIVYQNVFPNLKRESQTFAKSGKKASLRQSKNKQILLLIQYSNAVKIGSVKSWTSFKSSIIFSSRILYLWI